MIETGTTSGALADRQLREEQIIWLTTVRADGQPQSVPVWFLWDGETMLIYSRPEKQKIPNIRQNSRVALNFNSDPSANHLTRFQGRAEIASDAPAANDVPEFIEKYRAAIARIGMTPESFAQAYSVPIRIRPTWFTAR
jgi:PPOX class probable F420-dependent enzyme